MLAFQGEKNGSEQLYVRKLEQLQAFPLPGTVGASQPFFSPDGQWIGFFAEGKLKKVAVTGGPAVTICDAPQPRGGAWGEDGDIVFSIRICLLAPEFAIACVARVRWYADRVPECALEMPRTHTREFRQLTQGDRVPEVVVNVVRHDPQATPCEPTASAWRIPLQGRIRPDHMMGEEFAGAIGVEPT